METSIPVEPSKVVIEVVRTEIIKPLTPTPDHLKKFGMTVCDQIVSSNIYTSIAFFYPAGVEMSVADRNKRLKESLSETLARFYPVAGRVDMEGVYVDCDDGGATFVETKVNGCSLADILRCLDNEVLLKLLPCSGNNSGPGSLMRVQSNAFECGGIAVGACFSHLIMDGCSRSAFIKDWVATAGGGGTKRSPPPNLDAIASRFAAIPTVGFSDKRIRNPPMGAMRRFVFSGAKITSLRDRATSASGVRPTRVEAVTALIYKCMVNSLTKQLGQEMRPSAACQATNLRRMFDPPLSESSLGNLVWHVVAESGDQNEFLNDLPSIIAQFRKGMRDLARDCMTNVRDSMVLLEYVREVIKGWRDKKLYFFSSLCGFGLYESDFGWGKPVWVSIADTYMDNMVRMMDSREGGGIEAWVTLSEEDMALFETNTDLLEFASLNPPISLS